MQKSWWFRALVVVGAGLVAGSWPAATASAVVPGGPPNPLQALIDAAPTGSTIDVPPGVYVGGIDFKRKDIRLHATNGAAVTTIDGAGGTGVVMGPAGVLDGFTIQGASESFGAGVAVSGVGSLITHNVFVGNEQRGGGFGAAIGGNGASPTITQNRFTGNTCDSQFLSGVVAFVNSSSPTITNNEFVGNPCRAINLTLPSGNTPTVVNNTFVQNQVGVRVDGRVDASTITVRNNVLTGNGVGLEVDFGSPPTWDHNLVWQNSTDYQGTPDPTGSLGNLRGDPQYRDPTAGDHRLSSGSPAVDAGSSAGAPLVDLDGAIRPVDGNGDGVRAVDLGAYERGLPVRRFHPIQPTRLVDTRLAQGATRLGPGGTIDAAIAGLGGVPSSGVSAVSVNLTVVEPTDTTFVTAWPAGLARPTTSSVNAPAGAIIANGTQLALGTNGHVSVFNAVGSVDVLIDVVGWFDGGADRAGNRYVGIRPQRIMDTRLGQGGPTLGPGSTDVVHVAGVGGIPAGGVTAVALNLTSVNQSTGTFFTAWPAGAPRPTASTLNAPPGYPVPNFAVVPVSASGDIALYNAQGTADAVIDVAGWWSADPAVTDGAFQPIAPSRVLDTRIGLGAPIHRIGPGGTVEVNLAGLAGTTEVPARAVAVNITAAQPTTPSLITAFPSGTAPPGTSNLNLIPARDTAGFAIVKVGANGTITLHNSAGDVDLIVDLLGWYTGP